MKSLCKLKSKDVEKNIASLVKDVVKPKYFCEKCARASKKKAHLCRPVKIIRLSGG